MATDWGLRGRMALTMFLLNALYIVFLGALRSIPATSRLSVVMGLFLGAQFFFSDKLALYSMGARTVEPEDIRNFTGPSTAWLSRPTSRSPRSPSPTRGCPTPSLPAGHRQRGYLCDDWSDADAR